MNHTKPGLLLLVAFILGACAGMEVAIDPPVVSLKKVDVADVDFSKQTFVLSFDVSNPNSFPLPINFVSYGLKLDDQRFASGETVAAFTVAANSVSELAISVDLDLLRTAPQLLYILRDGVTRDLPYELKGKFGIDIPFVDSVSFEYAGEIRLQSRFVTRATKPKNVETP
jgi:LEA14-like dessication related protein